MGFDRADGTTTLPNQPLGTGGTGSTVGTPSPAGAIITQSSVGDVSSVEEDVTSPTLERAEQATCEHTLTMAFDAAKNYIVGLGRGTFVADSFGNIFRILSSKIQSLRADRATLSYVAESISFDSPPDDYQMIPVELGIDILKHPRYSWALLPFASDQSTTVTVGDTTITYQSIKQSIVRLIQSYRDSPFYPSADQVNGLIQNNIVQQLTNVGDVSNLDVLVPVAGYDPQTDLISPPRWDGVTANLPAGNYAYAIVSVPVDLSDPTDPLAIAIAAANEVISKLWRQEDTPYVVGFQVTWTQYYFAPVYENPGGHLENPIGIVPDYFMSPSQDGSDTIFDFLAAYNPQCYSQDGLASGDVDVSWLRKADEVEYQRTWFKVTRTWIGSPIGHWDSDLYTSGSRPQDANGFNVLP